MNDPEDDILEPGEDIAGDEGADLQNDDDQDDGEEEIVFGTPEDDDTAADLPKRLRAEIKERDRKLAIANKRLAELDKPAPVVEVGPRPTRDEFDWDDEKYDAAIDKWNRDKFAAEQQASAPTDLETEAKADVAKLQTGLSSLAFADASEVVGNAMEALTDAQQFMISQASNESAKLIYALGKNPDRLAALSAIKNPVKFIAEVARMEAQMTTTRRKAPPPPENIRQGDARPAQGGDKELARLQKQAEASGDYSALLAHKRKLRDKAA
ncbi:hypothetical protein L7H23_01185 [Sphingopyxis sp. BSN-002]|uniref:hypothetical protein n=1 Tax=Sphingopyxis sp. BSN-002 TaxID=2911495 RepID=UPI001EDAB4C9|nr:hypothetical protein [Sphingopyxis sp. BSN-002]UKK84747.1 hypothetical protein L7H23_01185 [Sphingopyxis sp. BSN-002]